jgi:hypothetical protein
MPRHAIGDRPLTDAERAARYRKAKAERAAQQDQLGAEALAFLLSLEDQDAYSMPWEKKKRLRDLQFRARMKAFNETH